MLAPGQILLQSLCHWTTMLYRCRFFLVHMYLLDMNVWKIVFIFYMHVSSCLSVCLCEMSMQRTVLFIIFIIFEQQDAFRLGTMVIFKGPVTAKRLVRAHGLEKTRNGALLYFLYAYHACHVTHVYLACLSHTTRLSAYRSAWHVLP